MKVYVTKYALTRGILLMEVGKTAFVNVFRNLSYPREYFDTDEWFKSELEAIKDAEQRREKKLIQLKNQISKLENKNVTIIKEV